MDNRQLWIIWITGMCNTEKHPPPPPPCECVHIKCALSSCAVRFFNVCASCNVTLYFQGFNSDSNALLILLHGRVLLHATLDVLPYTYVCLRTNRLWLVDLRHTCTDMVEPTPKILHNQTLLLIFLFIIYLQMVCLQVVHLQIVHLQIVHSQILHHQMVPT